MAEPLIFSFFERFDRQGPGEDASTLRAWNAIKHISDEPALLDVGCGTGAQTLCLAKHTPARITAVDLHQPYLEILQEKARQLGVKDRIQTVASSMEELPFPDEGFDIIWSEGAIYIIGFERGLREWSRLLKPGGAVVLSEVTWLKPNPPPFIKNFWHEAYPSIALAEKNIQRAAALGYQAIDHFTLPAHAWTDLFYAPIEKALSELGPGNNAEETAFYKEMQDEVQLYRDYSEWYGYEFYVLERR